MSLLSWLFPSKPKAGARHAAAPAQSHAVAAADGPKGERTQRREHLYLAVRDTMVRSGVLSSGYKFKVLSLDADGRQFLVMLDIAPGYGADTARQAEMEELLMRTAKTRFHVEVTAVYWRLNDALASADRPGSVAPAVAQAPQAPVVREAPAPPPAVLPVAQPPAKPDFEPIAPDEVEAFKQALKKAAPPPAVAAPTHSRPPAEEGSAAGSGFADTMIVDQEERASRLGATQYGELH
ncbi:MAG: hypothetical protein ABT03_11500 [Comamonas sp. SCN 67-35]|uniref:hypothetical protein n=1 Tax=Comamonas sp. SCN 67-35 TaxID=1660096 RepID=UPI00086994F4|nr:hypothetical protein [Comamonas sp. SCN 67-35]MBN9331147.1 hypothetical protein [Comamonas sp.]ODU37683.1 MAG: hypothetical protein ABT03_11500 [Comamonas sp. SCN 67-35]OJX02861.1 MAG: hypothetical protein BGO73_05660 [Burkholderiales bacterium 66-26]